MNYVKNILELDKTQKINTYKLFKKYNEFSNISTLDEYIKHCKSSHFNNGRDYYILIEEDSVKAVAGLITKSIKESGDAYITNISCKEEDKDHLDYLLKYIRMKTGNLPKHKLKVGFNKDHIHIEEILLKNGGSNSYEILEMRQSNYKLLEQITENDNLKYELLTDNNETDYIFAHNESFKKSPNGSTIDKDDMKDIYENYNKYPYYEIAVVYKKDVVVGFYEILIDNNVGEIDSIGVIPEYQGNGFGLQILKRTVDRLKEQKVRETELIVVDTNKKAFEMYKKYGFKVKKVYSKWYELNSKRIL